jgi:hypothetical protein
MTVSVMMTVMIAAALPARVLTALLLLRMIPATRVTMLVQKQ